LDRGHVLAGAEHLLALGRQTHFVLADVLGVRDSLVMLRGMSARKSGGRSENERPDRCSNPEISDHLSLILELSRVGRSECLADADVETPVSRLPPRVVDAKVYAVFACEKKANADAACRKQLVGIEIRKAVSNFADAGKGHESEAAEESQPLRQHEPVFSL